MTRLPIPDVVVEIPVYQMSTTADSIDTYTGYQKEVRTMLDLGSH
jgi:hypothetical protein